MIGFIINGFICQFCFKKTYVILIMFNLHCMLLGPEENLHQAFPSINIQLLGILFN